MSIFYVSMCVKEKIIISLLLNSNCECFFFFCWKNGMFEVPKTKTATANKKFVEEKKDTLVMLLLSLKSTMHWIQKRVLLLHEAYKEKEI